MTDVDQTMAETAANIQRTEALFAEAAAVLKELESLGDQGLTAEVISTMRSMQSAEKLAEAEKDLQEARDELERDFPKREARRTVRVRPTRNMV